MSRFVQTFDWYCMSSVLCGTLRFAVLYIFTALCAESACYAVIGHLVGVCHLHFYYLHLDTVVFLL